MGGGTARGADHDVTARLALAPPRKLPSAARELSVLWHALSRPERLHLEERCLQGGDTMRRREFLAVSLMITGRAVGAQQMSEMRRVGVLASERAGVFPEIFRQALAELGWIEGRNLSIDWPASHVEAELLAERAAGLVRAKCDVIVAGTPAAVRAAQRVTRTIPIVMVNTADPIELGVVESLARPNGNVTGTSTFSAEISAKQFDLLIEIIPHATRLAALWVADNPWHPLALAAIENGARSRGLRLMLVKVSASSDLDNAIASIAAENAQGAIVLADPMTFRNRRHIAELALRHRLPAVYGLRDYADAGGLMSYWAELSTLYRRTAGYVDKILRGAKPSDLPIEQATRFELVINAKTANELGLTIPPLLLNRADEIIE
jgi:putative ABC transport system substrate-binding protein